MANPFNYNLPVAPRDFVGRWNLVHKLAEDLGSETGNSHAVIGGRRFGKSSLLLALWHEAMQRQSSTRTWATLPVYISGQSIEDLNNGKGLYASALQEVKNGISGAWRSRQAPHCPFRLDAAQIDWPDILAPGVEGNTAFASTIHAVSELAKGSGYDPFRIVILIDETETFLDHSWSERFFGNLRSLIYDAPADCAGMLRLVFAGSGRLLVQTSPLSAWTNVLSKSYLEVLDKASTNELGARFEGLAEELRSWVVAQSGGHPFIAQYLLHELWDRCNGNPDELTLLTAQQVAEQMLADRHGDFNGWWIAIGSKGQSLYRRLMNKPGSLQGSREAGLALRYHGLIRQDRGSEGTDYRVAGELYTEWVKELGLPLDPPPPPPFPPIPPRADEDPPMFKLTLQFSQFGSQVQVRIDGGAIAGVASANIMLPNTPQLDTFAPSAVLRAAGQALYQALLGGSVGEVFRSVRNAARREGQPVTLQLRFDREAVQLAQYPWELLHDGDQFLLLSGPGIDIVRYVTFPQAVTAVRVQPPLTVVLVASSPSDLPALDVTGLLGTLQELGNVQVNQIDPATYSQLVTRLGPAQPAAHVFHFEGHGSFTAEQGGIYFEDNKSKSAFVTAEGLATALSRSNIALAVVNACHSAEVEGISLFNSIAPALVLAGVPAVIGMQGQITDHAATDFAGALYEDLSRCVSVTAAVAHARTFLFQGNEWYKPVLYLRSTDDTGQILTGCESKIDDGDANGGAFVEPGSITITVVINGRVFSVTKAKLEAVSPVRLHQGMKESFSSADFEILAWELGVKAGFLEGANLPTKMISLIDWHAARGTYAELVAKVIEERPHLAVVLLE